MALRLALANSSGDGTKIKCGRDFELANRAGRSGENEDFVQDFATKWQS